MPFYGFAVMCIDHPEVQEHGRRASSDRRVITYGRNPQADVRAASIFDIPAGEPQLHDRDSATAHGRSRAIEDLRLPMPGEHNVLNATAAIAVAARARHRR